MKNSKLKSLLIFLFLLSITTIIAQEKHIPLNDLSGLTTIGDQQFIGLHDMKSSEDSEENFRFSLITLPNSNQKYLKITPLFPKYIEGIPLPCDLESACNLPDNQGFLFCESGQCWGGEKRIFYTKYNTGNIEFISFIDWPIPVSNVEATEVCKVNDKLVFLYAERAQGEQSTYIRWAPISLDPLTLGSFQEVLYKSKMPLTSSFRPVVGMDIDNEGNIYIVSSYDPGIDTGPFKSAILKIGYIRSDKNGIPVVKLKKSKVMGTMDGLKVESISIIETPDGEKHIYYGTDDEHHKGIIRQLP